MGKFNGLRYSLQIKFVFFPVLFLGLVGVPTSPGVNTSKLYLPLIVTALPSNGIWISRDEVMALPTKGSAWERLKDKADEALGAGNMGDQDSRHDIDTLAVALVAVRTGDPTYRVKAVNALMSVIGSDEQPDSHCEFTPNKARGLAIARNLTAYIIAADLINLRPGTDGAQGYQWADYVTMLRFKPNCPNTGSGSSAEGDWLNLSQLHDQGGSNANAQAGAARIAAALYLNDKSEVEKAWQTYQRYAGDRTQCPACPMNINEGGITWAHDYTNPVPVNPAGAVRDGHSIDGAIINDMSRGGYFSWPPNPTHYPWVALEGFVAQAHMLARAGYPAWAISQQAPKRAVAYLKYLGDQFGNDWWDRTDWIKYIINQAYPGTNYSVGPAKSGFIMAWTDWTHALP